MIGALIMLSGITALAWIVLWLDRRGQRAERAERAARSAGRNRHARKHPA